MFDFLNLPVEDETGHKARFIALMAEQPGDSFVDKVWAHRDRGHTGATASIGKWPFVRLADQPTTVVQLKATRRGR